MLESTQVNLHPVLQNCQAFPDRLFPPSLIFLILPFRPASPDICLVSARWQTRLKETTEPQTKNSRTVRTPNLETCLQRLRQGETKQGLHFSASTARSPSASSAATSVAQQRKLFCPWQRLPLLPGEDRALPPSLSVISVTSIPEDALPSHGGL